MKFSIINTVLDTSKPILIESRADYIKVVKRLINLQYTWNHTDEHFSYPMYFLCNEVYKTVSQHQDEPKNTIEEVISQK